VAGAETTGAETWHCDMRRGTLVQLLVAKKLMVRGCLESFGDVVTPVKRCYALAQGF